MSRGPGKIERVLTELFACSVETDTVLTVADLCRHAFGSGSPPTRAQRISALRAAHRVIVRARRDSKRAYKRLIRWRITERADRTIVFHDCYYPVRVWAVQITPNGLVWAEADITSITKRRVNIRYRGEHASLDRAALGGLYWAVWRGVYFVSERNGFAAKDLDQEWARRYGHLFPTLLPLEEARRLLGVPEDYSRPEVLSAFRRAAKHSHPDHGGTAEEFRALVEARDRLLASIGIRAPKIPQFTPSGVKLVYRAISSTSRLGDSNAGVLRISS
jgi:hypothetical protein